MVAGRTQLSSSCRQDAPRLLPQLARAPLLCCSRQPRQLHLSAHAASWPGPEGLLLVLASVVHLPRPVMFESLKQL